MQQLAFKQGYIGDQSAMNRQWALLEEKPCKSIIDRDLDWMH